MSITVVWWTVNIEHQNHIIFFRVKQQIVHKFNMKFIITIYEICLNIKCYPSITCHFVDRNSTTDFMDSVGWCWIMSCTMNSILSNLVAEIFAAFIHMKLIWMVNSGYIFRNTYEVSHIFHIHRMQFKCLFQLFIWWETRNDWCVDIVFQKWHKCIGIRNTFHRM